jgi:dephospho-CoA kinase
MIVLGLTGSVGMGKSTTANMFAEEGVPVFDADAEVHHLYDGEAAKLIEAVFPGTTVDGRVDRERLAAQVFGDPQALARLELVVHPFVRSAEKAFLTDAAAKGANVAVLNIPLLLETGADKLVDAVLVVTAPADVQRSRIFARPNMTEEKFKAMLSRQMDDSEKCRRADFVIDTSRGLEAARAEVRKVLRQLVEKGKPARRK